LLTSPEGVRRARSRLKENQDSPAGVVCWQLLHEGDKGGRHPIPTTRQNGILDLAESTRGQAYANESWKPLGVLFFFGSADDIAATKVLEIIGESGQRCHDIVDVGDIFLPLRLLVLSLSELGQIDSRGHGWELHLPIIDREGRFVELRPQNTLRA